MPPSSVFRRTIIIIPPLALTINKVFNNTAIKVTTFITSSIVVILLTTILLRTVMVSCVIGKG